MNRNSTVERTAPGTAQEDVGLRHLTLDPISSAAFAALAGVSLSTAKRLLDRWLAAGLAERVGLSRATRYRRVAGAWSQSSVQPTPATGTGEFPTATPVHAAEPVPAAYPVRMSPPWSEAALAASAVLDQPLGMRTHVTYQRRLVDDYRPNVSSLLPPNLARALAEEGRMQGQQPAGTYARKVLEPLLVDLSWSSSRLEGNRYSLLDTERLFRSGTQAGDLDAVMLLNHKSAIEFLVDAVPAEGLTGRVVGNLHAVLMRDLLPDSAALGAVRRTVVNITDTVYLPTQMPALLEEMLALVLDKARQIKNPVEAAFFLWVNIAYLQPFEDGNKRCSRLCANIPLMLYNCAPLSFLEVQQSDYARAMLGVYELLDMSVAADLFAWTYRRSLRKYRVVLEAVGQPDPLRLRYRETLADCIGRVVRDGQTLESALASASPPADDRAALTTMLAGELRALTEFNFARYRLGFPAYAAWVARGRPS